VSGSSQLKKKSPTFSTCEKVQNSKQAQELRKWMGLFLTQVKSEESVGGVYFQV
jgi:hypothetical protein